MTIGPYAQGLQKLRPNSEETKVNVYFVVNLVGDVRIRYPFCRARKSVAHPRPLGGHFGSLRQ